MSVQKYFLDKRTLVSGKHNPFLNLANFIFLNDVISQIVAGSIPGQPVLPYVFTNGITQSGPNVGLGGQLIQPTQIDGRTAQSFDFYQIDVFSVTEANSILLESLGDMQVRVGTNYGEIIGGNYVSTVAGTHDTFAVDAMTVGTNSDYTLTVGGAMTTSVTDNILVTGSADMTTNIAAAYSLTAQLIDFTGDYQQRVGNWYIENNSIALPYLLTEPVTIANGHYTVQTDRAAGSFIQENALGNLRYYSVVKDEIAKYVGYFEVEPNKATMRHYSTVGPEDSYVQVGSGSTEIVGGTTATFGSIRIGSAGILFDSDLLDGYLFPKADGINGQTLITNGAGTLTWGSVASAFAVQNGLNLTGTVAELGGPLVRNTSIDGQNLYSFEVQSVTSFVVVGQSSTTNVVGDITLQAGNDIIVTATSNTQVTTPEMYLEITSTTAADGDVLTTVDALSNQVEFRRQYRYFTVDVVAWNTLLVGAGQAQSFIRLPSNLAGWYIESILVGVGQTATDACDVSIELENGGFPTLTPVTIPANTSYVDTLLNTPIVAGDYVRVQNIIPGGTAPRGLTLTLTIKNAL